jgi:FAD/FMN-containing dehydrogenase
MTGAPTPATLARLADVVGPSHALTDPAAQLPYLTEWRGLWPGHSPMVLRPASADEVSRLLALAHETGTAIVPQSGNTGLAAGQMPDVAGTEVVLSLDRMSKVRNVDAAGNSLTAEAGVTIKAVQDAAAAVDRLFPLSLASEGSARLGGVLSTNAGGVNVLAYGTARQLCLGLEVVLADGRIWSGLRSLRKDNTGYDLKELFLGAEGTLGIITAAVVKLFPRPLRCDTAFVAVPDPRAAVDLLARAQSATGNRLVAFEFLPRLGLEFLIRHMAGRDPLSAPSPWYVLCEAADAPEGSLETLIGLAIERGLATDAVIAQSAAQRAALWSLRENLSESQKFEGGSIKHDVSVPVSKVPEFIAEAEAAVARFLPGARPFPFGHLGDGNVHFNVSQPPGMDKTAYTDMWEAMNEVVFGIVLKHGGSISAEHGIGRLKRHWMSRIKSPVELDLMRGLKHLLDPKGILNPHKVLPE